MPEKIVNLPRATAIAGFGSALAILDEHGQMWTAQRADRCEVKLWKVAVPKSGANLHNPRWEKIVALSAGPNPGGLATTSDGITVRWFPDGRGIAFTGVHGLTPSCTESEHTCLPNTGPRIADATMIALGGVHDLVLRTNGEVWSGGWNDCGQLGRTEPGSPPGHMGSGHISALRDIAAVSAGYRNSLALTRAGKVLEWGNTSNGHLWSESGKPTGTAPYCHGHFDDPDRSDLPSATPREVAGLSDIKAISAFYAFNLALKKDGTVWGWGQNGCGQLGIVPAGGRVDWFLATPVRIEGLPSIQAIAAGKRHALALDDDGAVWAWGYNFNLELGYRPAQQDASSSCDIDGRAPDLARFNANPLRVPGLPKVKAVTAAYNISAALDENGEVWVWGLH